MRIAFSGDFHVHNYGAFAQPWREGLNSRVQDIYEVVGEWLPKELRKRAVDVFVFMGDANFNASNDYRLVNITRAALTQCEQAVETILAIHGNHDTTSASQANHNVFPYFRSANWGPIFEVEDTCFVLLGYNVPLTEVMNEPGLASRIARKPHVVVCLHKDLEGGQSASGFIYKSSSAISRKQITDLKARLPQARFFAGHYHHPQRIGEAYAVGAPVQHNRGDEGSKRGFVIYDTKTEKIEYVEAPGPRFLSRYIDQLSGVLDFRNKIVYLTISVPAGNAKAYKRAQEIKILHPNTVIKEVRENTVAGKPIFRDVKLLSDSELLGDWLETNHPELKKKERVELVTLAERL